MKYAASNSKDEVFLQELEQLILENLQNDQFSVEVLATLKGVSRSHLHRKLKSLAGKSVSQFIREVKLKEGMKLLQIDVANVSEIAYQVGFSSTSYFNTCFHNYYGYPPGEVKKRNQRIATITDLETIEGTQKQSFGSSSISEKQHNSGVKHQPNLKRGSSLKILLYAGILLGALVMLYFTYWSKTEHKIAGPRAIAILPLDHLSGDPDQEYLTAGIHDALIGELGTIKGLRVISRTSTLRYVQSNLLIQEIANELGVDAIIEGSVLIDGDSLRLQLQLIEAFPKERHLWAQEYYQNISNILSLQSEVIQDIANTIQVRLTTKDKQRLATSRRVDPETYKAYLRGIYYLNKSTPEEFQKGLQYLNEAVSNDPADPFAYAGLAEGYAILGHGPDPSNAFWRRGKAAALRAIELDSTLAKAHAALAMIKLYYENDWEGAERAFIKANSINPNMAFNHFHYAWYHVMLGQMSQAVAEHKLAKELDPLTPIITADMGMLYYWLGRNDEAIVELKQALELDNNFAHAWWALGNVYVKKGWYDQAIAAHSNAVKINSVWKWALANTYVLAGHKDKALHIVSELRNDAITPRVAFGLALIYVSLRDVDEAFYWLEFGVPDVWVPWIRTWPDFELLRKDPRFDKFLQERNLPPIPPSAT